MQTFIKIMLYTVIKFYSLNLNPNEIKKDLLLNTVTTLIMKDQAYSIVMNSILQSNQNRIREIFRNMNKFKFKISLEKLGVTNYFQLNRTFRE